MGGNLIAQYLDDLTGPDIYRRNVFRIVGLNSTATSREIRQRRQHLTLAASSGVPLEDSGPIPLPTPPTESEIRTAFDVLSDPRQRIVHELFWMWGSAADVGCGCTKTLHLRHDKAVRAHARALDLELTPRKNQQGALGVHWSTALESWALVIEHRDFERHVWHRIDTLDDPRLAQAPVTEFRDALSLAVVAPTALLAVAENTNNGTHVEYLSQWAVPPTAVNSAAARVLESPLARIEATLEDAQRLQRDNNHQGAANLVVTEAKATLLRVRPVAEAGHHRRAMLMLDQAAVFLNNICTQASPAQVRRWTTDPVKLRQVISWLDLAATIATDPTSRKNIEGNRDELVAMRDLLDRVDGRTSTPPPPKPTSPAIGDPDFTIDDLFGTDEIPDHLREPLGRPPRTPPVQENAAVVVHRWMNRIISSDESKYLYQLMTILRSRTKNRKLRSELEKQMKLLAPRERERRRRGRWRWLIPLSAAGIVVYTFVQYGLGTAALVAVPCASLLAIWGIVTFRRLLRRITSFIISDPDVMRSLQ